MTNNIKFLEEYPEYKFNKYYLLLYYNITFIS